MTTATAPRRVTVVQSDLLSRRNPLRVVRTVRGAAEHLASLTHKLGTPEVGGNGRGSYFTFPVVNGRQTQVWVLATHVTELRAAYAAVLAKRAADRAPILPDYRTGPGAGACRVCTIEITPNRSGLCGGCHADTFDRCHCGIILDEDESECSRCRDPRDGGVDDYYRTMRQDFARLSL